MYTIKLSDSVQVDTYAILKPEFSCEFDPKTPTNKAYEYCQEQLDLLVDRQLDTIVRRMSYSQKRATLKKASIDPRFEEKIKRSSNSE